MNKIAVFNDLITKLEIDDSIEIEFTEKNEIFNVNRIKLNIKKNTSLEIIYDSNKDIKLDIYINVLPNIDLNINEIRFGKVNKIQYKYFLDAESTTLVNKFYDLISIKESNLINLNGIGASIDYNFKTISNGSEKYDMTVYHNFSNTSSNIKNNGVNINSGNLTFNVSSFVLNGKKNCFVDQANRIINLTNNKCQINPNLFIDEYDVSANHSAHIGRFSEEEMFYLNSRGIDNNTAISLLIAGFLGSNMPIDIVKDINNSIKKYWS